MTAPGWAADAVFYQIFPDRFANGDDSLTPPNAEPWGARPTRHGFQGGDLQGVINRLDYLEDLGINAIYFNPIFVASSNHRYNTFDYYTVDPKLGSNADLKRLLDAAHRRGIRVVLDGVFNHSGRAFFAFADLLENGARSPYVDWFTVHKWPVNAYKRGKPNYNTWWGVKSLPQLNSQNPAVVEYLLNIGTYWIAQGIDGWRLDVPNELSNFDFWAQFRSRIRAINPEAYLVGEIWEESPTWIGAPAFDALMNYPMRKAVLTWLGGMDGDSATLTFANEVERLLTIYPLEYTQVQFNVVGSHDTRRLLTLLKRKTSLSKLVYTFLFTYVGAPVVYYGDEIGLLGGDDPGCRRAFPWDDGRWQRSTLRSQVQQLARLRHQHIALRRGDFTRVAVNDATRLYAYARTHTEENLLVVLNAGNEAQTVDLAATTLGWQDGSTVRDLLGGKRYSVTGDQVRQVRVSANSGVVVGVA